MGKTILVILYLLIGLFFMGQTLALAASDKYKNEKGKGPHAAAVLIISLLELFLWPAMIALTAGFTIGKRKDD